MSGIATPDINVHNSYGLGGPTILDGVRKLDMEPCLNCEFKSLQGKYPVLAHHPILQGWLFRHKEFYNTMAKKDTYAKNQLHILSNIGLFYIIIIAFFAVPLLAAFVVVLIQGVVDYRYAILGGGVLLLILVLYGLIQFMRKTFQKIRQDGFAANQEVREKMTRREPVQISMLGGLLTFTYGGGQGYVNNALPYYQESQKEPILLPHATERQPADMIVRLKELSELKNQGVINEDEFEIIKKRLITGSESSSDDSEK